MLPSEPNYDPATSYNCKACTEPDDHDDLIECECQLWYHYGCAGVTKDTDLNAKYYCKNTTCQNLLAQLENDLDMTVVSRSSTPITGTVNSTTNAVMYTSTVTTMSNTRPTFMNPPPRMSTGAFENQITSCPQQAFMPFGYRENNDLELERLKAIHELEIKFLNERLQRMAVKPQPQVHSQTPFELPSQPAPSVVKSRVKATSVIDYYEKFPSVVNAHPRVLTKEQLASRHVLDKVKLPVFDGKPEDWLRFICNFEQTTAACAYSNVENLGRLTDCIKGKALDHVRSCLYSPDMVPAAIDTLRMIYGRPELIISKMRADVLKMSNVRSMQQCIDFSLKVQHLSVAIESTKIREYLYDYVLVQELVNKLPDNLKLEWAVETENSSASNIGEFSVWLTRIARLSSHVTLYSDQGGSKSNDNFNKRMTTASAHVHTAMENKKSTRYKCPICKSNDHELGSCTEFTNKDRNQRWKVINDNNTCRTCLQWHVNMCPRRKECGIDGCTAKHHPLLHKYNQPANDSQKSAPSVNGNENKFIGAHSMNKIVSVLYKVVPVMVYGKNEKCLETLIFIDEGASVLLIDQSLVEELGVHGPKEYLRLNWTSGMFKSEPHSEKIVIKVSSVNNHTEKYKMQLRTVTNLQLPVQQLDDSLNNYNHLNKLQIHQYTSARPRILLGLDNYHIVMPTETRTGNVNEPMAINTKLGWIIFGKMSTEPKHESVFFFHNEELESNNKNDNLNPDDDLHKLVKDYFSLDSMGIQSSKPPASKDDKRALEILNRTTTRINDKYETGLLWKEDNVKFPSNFEMAQRRMISFERKLSKTPNVKENVIRQIRGYQQKGYIRKLRDDESIFGDNIWYLPIFTVSNPNKPDRCRIVWDAAAECNGVSLNSKLLKGPDLITPLPSILCRFREGTYAISGDIQEMYHRVQVRSEDQPAQRFIFREQPNQPAEIFVMQVLTFGSTCSPSSAIYTMNKNAEQFINSHPRAVRAIHNNHYLDDWLDSDNNEQNLMTLATDVRDIHKHGNFHMSKWISNSIKVLQTIQGGDVTAVEKNIGQTNDKVLGIWWRTMNDTIGFSIKIKEADEQLWNGNVKPTKRQVLKILMSVFDPLGVIGFIIVFGKILLQRIWRTNIEWDDEICDSLHCDWKRWTKVLSEMQNVHIPRAYTTFGDDKRVQLHILMDASENAFACVAYWRFIQNDKIEVALVGGKTRVTPNKPVSIPRLELQAAILASRYAKFITESHTFKIERRYFWSDSADVLSWIRSEARKYKPFVALRIGELLGTTNVNEWRWVPTKLNTADDATKWQTTPQISQEHRWFIGPSFLHQDESCWPVQKYCTDQNNLEIRANVWHVSESVKLKHSTPDVHRFSNYRKLVNAHVFVLRAQRCFKKLIGNKRSWTTTATLYQFDPVTPEEFREAEIQIIKVCQDESFHDDIVMLKHDKNEFKSSSKLYRYSPYVDENGLLRICGRIDAANHVENDTKRPIILPNSHALTSLIVKRYHDKYLHRNFETIINEIRRRFEIPRLRTLMKNIRKNCMACKIIYAKPITPLMGPLPPSRLAAYERPFTHIAIDYFGPFIVHYGRRTEKRWGVLVTCMTTRAIHVEVAASLTTDSCIMALRRTFAIRGTAKSITSDRGTNFRGASRELIELINNVSTTEMQRYFHQTEWIFIPPYSPHMGGLWERLVRSVKSNITEILANRKLTDEVLRTTFFEVTQIINNRPLTDVPIETESQPAITPNDLLNIPSILEKPPGEMNESERVINLRLSKSWKMTQQLANQFWKRWLVEFLPNLTKRTKWYDHCKPICVNDIVIVCDESLPRCSWMKGKVMDVIKSRDGIIRSAVVKTQSGIYTRPVVKLAILDVIGKPTCEAPVDLRGKTVDNAVAMMNAPSVE